MADVKISALPAVVTAAGTDAFPVVQGGVTKQETLSQALTWIQTQVAPVAAGGTGFGAYTIGDLLVADGAASLTKLADVATGNALISGGVGAAPTWGKIGLTTHVSGILPSANGGTGVNNAGTITNASNTTITGGGTLALGGFTLTVPATGSAALLVTANTFTAAQATTITDAGTNTTTTLLTLDHESSGTPAASFGTRILFNLQDNTTTTQNAAAMDVSWSTATHASHASQFKFFVATAGGGATSESIRLDNTGLVAIAGDTNSTLKSTQLTGNNPGGSYKIANLGTTASTNVTIWGSNTIAASQFIAFTFAATGEVARFLSDGVTASTSAVVDTFILRRNPTSGTPAAGTGHQFHMLGQSDTTANRDLFTLSSEWVVATDASRTVRTKLSVYDTAAREALRLEASGSAAMIGFLGAAAAAQQTGGQNLTNNVTSGGVDGTIANFTDLTVYANDAAAIRNDIYQLARSEKQVRDALRLFGFLS